MGCDHELLLDLSDKGLFRSLLMERSPLALVPASLLILERAEEVVRPAVLRFRKPVIFRKPLRKGEPGFLVVPDDLESESESVRMYSDVGDGWTGW